MMRTRPADKQLGFSGPACAPTRPTGPLASATGKVNQLLLRVNIELTIDRLDMRLNGSDGHAHELGNLLLTVALSQKARNLGLALGKRKALKDGKRRIVGAGIGVGA